MTILRVVRCDFCHKTAECPPPEAGSAVPPDYLPMGWHVHSEQGECACCHRRMGPKMDYHFCSMEHFLEWERGRGTNL